MAENGREIDYGVRCVVLEEQLRDSYALAARWREAYESMKDILVAASGPHPDIESLDEIIRLWVGRADG